MYSLIVYFKSLTAEHKMSPAFMEKSLFLWIVCALETLSFHITRKLNAGLQTSSDDTFRAYRQTT